MRENRPSRASVPKRSTSRTKGLAQPFPCIRKRRRHGRRDRSNNHDWALRRSRDIYRDDAARDAALDAFYAPLIPAGALVFDIGAHVGDRTACFRRLGARVLAVEPQADCAALLLAEFAGDDHVRILQCAIGARRGTAQLHRNDANPTVSTLSRDFIDAARDADGWREQSWSSDVDTEVSTLDDLIAEHGAPAFVKLDIEGFEHEALLGLSTPVAALSFEFTTIQRDVANRCLDRLAVLGYTSFRASLGESLSFAQTTPVTANDMREWLAALPHAANSGDVYASL